MGGFVEFDRYDAMGLAELVRQGQVTQAELCEEAIERIERVNPKLNAVVTRMYDQGHKEASEPLPEGPFTGVPLLIKDLHYAYSGVSMTSGCKALKDYVPDQDCEMVVRFKKAGAVIIGKTNTPEFGLLGVTEPELFGPCRNPWNTDCTPGGSSGGSAAAVAARMVPIASGGDGGGSIRIPSAYCGLFGLKPSRGRNPTGPDHGSVWQDAVQNHVITRSVRDSAAMLDATQKGVKSLFDLLSKLATVKGRLDPFSEFEFIHLSREQGATLRQHAYRRFIAKDFLDTMAHFRAGLRGFHPFMIAFVDSPMGMRDVHKKIRKRGQVFG